MLWSIALFRREAMVKDKQIHIRLSVDEIKKIYERMEILEMTNMSQYIRLMATKGSIVHLDLTDMNEVLRLMRINSNNLNQYAKKANETGNIYKREMDVLREQQEEMWELLKIIADRLSTI